MCSILLINFTKISLPQHPILFPLQANTLAQCTEYVKGIELRHDGLVIGDWGSEPVDLCYINKDTPVPSLVVVKKSSGVIYGQFIRACCFDFARFPAI